MTRAGLPSGIVDPTFQLYRLADVRAALGIRAQDIDDAFDDTLAEREPTPDTDQGARLRKILARGEQGCWRRLAHPTPDAVEAVAALGALAPHMREASDLVTRHVKGRLAMGQPTRLPPILLVGPPGVGKSWYASRLAACLGVPYRSYAMSSSTLSEGLTGSHGSWRNSGPGLVARTLLQEPLANPVLFIDEFDKAVGHGWNADPYRPFYQLLEPEGARIFADEFLGFPMDASVVSYILTANGTDAMPAPILDRLTIVEVSEPDEVQQAVVAASLYREANATFGWFFAAEPHPAVVAELVRAHPRRARRALDDAMMRAAAEGRRSVTAEDVRLPSEVRRRRIGF